METLTAAELDARLRAAFGPRWRAWAYRCPECGEPATGADMVAAIDPHGIRPDALAAAFDALGQECIGRGRPWVGRGCDARAVTHGTVLVERADGTTLAAFPLVSDPDTPPDTAPDTPQDTVPDTPADTVPDTVPDTPDPVDDTEHYRFNDDAQRNRRAKAEALAREMLARGIAPEEVDELDKPTRLAIRKAAFGRAKSASDDTWTAARIRLRALTMEATRIGG